MSETTWTGDLEDGGGGKLEESWWKRTWFPKEGTHGTSETKTSCKDCGLRTVWENFTYTFGGKFFLQAQGEQLVQESQ